MTLRRGALTFGGSVIAAGSGFALSVLVGRALGTAGAGVFFAVTSGFIIASTVLKFGADTAQLWRLPRLISAGDLGELRVTLAVAFVPSLLMSLLVAVLVVGLSGLIAPQLSGGQDGLGVRAQLVWAASALVFMAPMSNLVAGTRGLGQVKPFVYIQNVALPLGRLASVAAVVSVGAGGVAVMAAWSVPVGVAFVLALGALHRRMDLVLDARSVSGRRSLREIVVEFQRFAMPRWVTASIEVVLIAVNTLVVAFFIGPAAAGVFGALAKFVTSGTLAEQAVRILVAPRFSALIGNGDIRAAERLYWVTTPWIVTVSWPIFVTLAAGAPAVLGIFGTGFEQGARALTLLALTMCLSQLAGNVQTILLMSGRSELQLLNKTVAVIVLLALDVLLIPIWGIVGAAAAWSASILTDTTLAVYQVRRGVGIRLSSMMLWRVMTAAAVCFGVPTAFAVHRMDAGLRGLVAALGLAVIAYLPFLWRWRHGLRLAELASRSSVDQAN